LIFLGIAVLWSACGNSQNKIQGAGSGKEYVLAYNIHLPDTTKDDWEIFAMNLDGSSKKNITNNRDVAWAYYAHKNRLYFVSDRDSCYRCFFLYEMNSNGTNTRRISNLQLESLPIIYY
jgi:TolB protein